MKFKLSEATHVGFGGRGGAFYGILGRIGIHTPSGGFIHINIGEVHGVTEIKDWRPDPYTGTAEEFTLDCLKRDLNAHDTPISGTTHFRFKCGNVIGYASGCVVGSKEWHQMPTHRGTVSQDATNPKNRALAGLVPLPEISVGRFALAHNKITAEDMIKHDEEKQTWDGEGLPPVGVVCEIYNLDVGSNFADWTKGKLVYNTGSGQFVWEDHDGIHVCHASSYDLRPIRTDREKAIDALTDSIGGLLRNGGEESIIDALDSGKIPGYGKLEK